MNPLRRLNKILLGVTIGISAVFAANFIDILLLPKEPSTLLIKPTFTEQAYQPGGWYDNDTHTTVSLGQPLAGSMGYGGSGLAVINYENSFTTKTDIDITKNPILLRNYTRIILLHNEYVTAQEYYGILNHTNVFYMSPNALARFVKFDEDHNTITRLNYTGYKYSLSNWTASNGVKVIESNQCLITYDYVLYPNGKGISCYPAGALLLNPFLRHAPFVG